MKKFNILKSIPSNLSMINVDTDMIIPKQFLKTIKRTGLGKSLFFEMRYDEKGTKIEKFVLNKEPYKNIGIRTLQSFPIKKNIIDALKQIENINKILLDLIILLFFL